MTEEEWIVKRKYKKAITDSIETMENFNHTLVFAAESMFHIIRCLSKLNIKGAKQN